MHPARLCVGTTIGSLSEVVSSPDTYAYVHVNYGVPSFGSRTLLWDWNESAALSILPAL